MSQIKPFLPAIFSVLVAAVYGLTIRAIYWIGGTHSGNDDLVGVLGVGFLCFVPLVIGLLTVYISRKKEAAFAVFTPWIGCFIFVTLAAILSWEAWVCIAMALPIFLVISSVGGLIMTAFINKGGETSKPDISVMGLVLILPLLVTPIESLVPVSDSIRVVHTQIEIEASPEAVWQQITRVSPITEQEHRFSFFHLAGLPRPVYATLTKDGVGGIRRGQWESGLAFTEKITEWHLHRSYTMQMSPDVEKVVSSPLPLHEIGGAYFDVLEGRYQIEPLDNNHVILHFTSTHRLSTRFNAYGGLWTDFFMSDVQTYILQIMKARAEQSQRQVANTE